MSIHDALNDLEKVSDAAKICGYSVSHVRLLADTGRVAARRFEFGKRGFWLVSISSLENYKLRRTAA